MKERTLQRMFQDFPWLWGIKQRWHALETEIKVAYPDRISPSLFIERWFKPNREYPSGHFLDEIWLVISGNGSDEIRELQIHDPAKIVNVISETIKDSKELLRYVIFVEVQAIKGISVNSITIFRPPKGQTFNQFLAECLE